MVSSILYILLPSYKSIFVFFVVIAIRGDEGLPDHPRSQHDKFIMFIHTRTLM